VVLPTLDIQIGADTLWLDAQAQSAADENSRVFAQWRAMWHWRARAGRPSSGKGAGNQASDGFIRLVL